MSTQTISINECVSDLLNNIAIILAFKLNGNNNTCIYLCIAKLLYGNKL